MHYFMYCIHSVLYFVYMYMYAQISTQANKIFISCWWEFEWFLHLWYFPNFVQGICIASTVIHSYLLGGWTVREQTINLSESSKCSKCLKPKGSLSQKQSQVPHQSNVDTSAPYCPSSVSAHPVSLTYWWPASSRETVVREIGKSWTSSSNRLKLGTLRLHSEKGALRIKGYFDHS